MYSAWQPSNPYSFAEQADDVRDEYIRAATVAIDEQMPGVLADCEAKRELIDRFVAMEKDVLYLTGRESIMSEYRRIILPLMAESYAKLGRPGYQESWRPA